MGSFRRLQTKQERLWSDEVPDMQFRLLVMHGFNFVQATDPDTVVTLQVIKVPSLLYDKELDDLRLCGSTERPSTQMERGVTLTMAPAT